jgi:uncharacterized membrane protein (DUF373 family)
MGHRGFEIAIAVLERVLAAVLLLLIAFAVIGLVVDGFHRIAAHGYLGMEDVLHLVEHVLTLFILIELFAIAMAYLRSRRVIRTVLEASLVAVARKLIAFEPTDANFGRGVTLAALFLAVAAAWWFLRRSRQSEPLPPAP